MTMVEPPFMIPTFQTSQKMPSINQTTPSNYHIYHHPGMNNSMLMQTPVYVQGSNIATPNQFLQNSNKLLKPVPFPALPNHRHNALPVQTTSTCQPFTEEFKPMLHPTFLYSDMPQPHSYEINGNASNVHGQYLMEPSPMVSPNLVPVKKQETEWSHLAAGNSSDGLSNSTNQATLKSMTEKYAKQEKESCFQQQQQQGDGNQIMDFVICHQSHQDVNETSVPVMNLPTFHDRETTPVHTVSTATDVQYEGGKQIIQCLQHVCIFCILQCHLIFGQNTHTHTYMYVCTYIYIYIYTCLLHGAESFLRS